LNAYLDASVLVALLSQDLFTARAEAFLRLHAPVLIVSDFAATEFASAMARRVRTRDLTSKEARAAFSNFDAWTARATTRVALTTADVSAAAGYIRRLDLTLRTPDALNIAVTQRIGATLVTFDDKMAATARSLATPVAST
jgi:uncharacterized protein